MRIARFILTVGMCALVAHAQVILDSGSDGSDGALNLTTPGEVVFDPAVLGLDVDGAHRQAPRTHVILEQASVAAKALQGVIATKPKRVIIQGKQYLECEDWQTIARFFGCTARLEWTKPVELSGAPIVPARWGHQWRCSQHSLRGQACRLRRLRF